MKLDLTPEQAFFHGTTRQFLSEPGGGSDVAGAQTTAVRDGDEWVLNGSKIWTTGAWWSDWGLCLARTNWDVPKHRGLSVFMLRIHQPGIDVHQIEMLNGSREFCQEFLTDLRIPDSDRIGEVDGGWTVGTRWMYHEKSLGISPYFIRPAGSMRGVNPRAPTPLAVARQAGRLADPVARQLAEPAVFFDGWAPDPGAFTSGMDFSTREVLDGEMDLLQDWYLRTIGEIPAYVGFLRQHRPVVVVRAAGYSALDGSAEGVAAARHLLETVLRRPVLVRSLRSSAGRALVAGS